MSLKDYVYTDVTAEIICGECDDVQDASGETDEAAIRQVVYYAEKAGKRLMARCFVGGVNAASKKERRLVDY
jgi:hypothetical protein